MDTQQYFKSLREKIDLSYEIAEEARSKGLDPKDHVEIPLAMSMAEKVVGLISVVYPQMKGTGISDRILELEKEYGKLDPAICLQIAEEVAKQKFCEFESLLQAIDAGVRIAFAYITLGVVSSPIEGLTEIKIKKTRDGKEYLSPFYSGPIRSAGGTGAAFSLVILDHLREVFGFAKFDPTEEEVKRAVTEMTDYHERITNLQYFPTEEEATFLAQHLPVQIGGEPTERLEVSNYKNLDRIETNFIRGGFCLTFAEGLAQKAAKINRYITGLRKKGFKLTDWDFLEGYIELHAKRDKGKTSDSPTYVKDLVAGRPIFGHPSKSGGFRFRYGRSRINGFSAASLHPATMEITDGFIATGTQLKIEKPTKGCAITNCDLIEGPIVKLKDGSVMKLKSQKEAKELYPMVEEIVYLGDILFPFGDLANRNYDLIKPGYVEEWWKLDLRKKSPEKEKSINCFKINFDEAIELSKNFQIPLHPAYIYYWTQISKESFNFFLDWLKKASIRKNDFLEKKDDSGFKLAFPYGKNDIEKFSKAKRALELIGIEHKVTTENVVLSELDTKVLLLNLGVDIDLAKKQEKIPETFFEKINERDFEDVLRIINSLSEFEIKDKAGDFIGTRMGRPEKAKLRKLVGSPNILFPVGNEGGRLRSVQEAVNQKKVRSSFPLFFCEKCNKETIYPKCEICKSDCVKSVYCTDCKDVVRGKVCPEHNKGIPSMTKNLDIVHYFQKEIDELKLSKDEIPPLIKGIRGLSSDSKIPERLGKGILRAMFDLQVNKDGTIRFDATELPVTHFKPKEVFVDFSKLKELGYDKDVYGNELTHNDQVLELKPHDVIIPSCPESGDERGDDVFIKIANFIDMLLVRFYGMKPFYNVRQREDLVGQLAICMAPHNCAGVISRIVGFSKTQGLFASPYMHAAVRRDCDGDEAAVMLLLDVLINFSRDFLPGHRGGTQDAPLVLNGKIDAGEVDDQILDFELVKEYPIELYELAEQRVHSSKVSVETVKNRLKDGTDPFVGLNFTHDVDDMNRGVLCSSYKKLATMQEKVLHQMNLVEKIRAANTSETARLMLERHFIRDIRGNLRKFSQQTFRCVGCNEIVRRVPLKGVCPKCKGKLIFTIHEGGIKKYLEPALELTQKYNLSPYIKQNMELVKKYIESIFGKELEKQVELENWF